MTLAAVKNRWSTFHQKEPRELIEIDAPWPKAWGYVGEAVRVYYLSDKWNEDGDFIPYYHDHDGGVELWEPWGAQDGMTDKCKSPARGIPCKQAAVLGYCLGWWLLDEDDPKKVDAVEFDEDEALLCSTASGKALFVVSLSDGKVIAAFTGGNLSVESAGIDG